MICSDTDRETAVQRCVTRMSERPTQSFVCRICARDVRRAVQMCAVCDFSVCPGCMDERVRFDSGSEAEWKANEPFCRITECCKKHVCTQCLVPRKCEGCTRRCCAACSTGQCPMCKKLLCIDCFDVMRDGTTPPARCGTCHVACGGRSRMERRMCVSICCVLLFVFVMANIIGEWRFLTSGVLSILILLMCVSGGVCCVSGALYGREFATGIAPAHCVVQSAMIGVACLLMFLVLGFFGALASLASGVARLD